jgi:hypothetical protein
MVDKQDLGPNQMQLIEELREGGWRDKVKWVRFWFGVISDPSFFTEKLAARSALVASRDGTDSMQMMADRGMSDSEVADALESDPANWFTEAR